MTQSVLLRQHRESLKANKKVGWDNDEKRCHKIVNKCSAQKKETAFGVLCPNMCLVYSEEFCCLLQSDLSNRGHTQIGQQANIV